MSNTHKYDPALVEALAKQMLINYFAPSVITWKSRHHMQQDRWRYKAREIIDAIDICGYTVVPKDDGR